MSIAELPMTTKPEMLTADEVEALRQNAKETRKFAVKAFGGDRPLTPDEIEAERRSDEWWAKHIAEMRERELAKRP